MTNLDIGRCTALTSIGCSNNQLTSIDITGITGLSELYCGGNRLTELNTSKNSELRRLYCENNQLYSLNVADNLKLTELHAYSNCLTSLNLKNNTALKTLKAYGNVCMISALPGESFDLSSLPGKFDPSRASYPIGGSISDSIIKIDRGVYKVSYEYDCGNGEICNFTLWLDMLMGDANCDGCLSARDMLYMRLLVAGLKVPDDFTAATSCLDLDGDGSITPADCLLLRKTLAGVIDIARKYNTAQIS